MCPTGQGFTVAGKELALRPQKPGKAKPFHPVLLSKCTATAGLLSPLSTPT